MLGQKEKAFQAQVVSLEQLVPQNNFYRQLEANLDLRFVYDLVKECYGAGLGRPSIDPVVFFKLQLIMFFEGIRSERQLMKQVSLNLAHRWYIGYDLDESVPDHSSLSKIRDRYGLVLFQRFFEKVVDLCQAAGLVWGQELYFDGTKVRANAAVNSLVPRWYWQAKPHLQERFPEEQTVSSQASAAPPAVSPSSAPSEAPAPQPPVLARLVEQYNGTRLATVQDPTYQRLTDKKVSPTDPDAAPMRRQATHARLGYHTHYVVDGGKARIILAALVTPASITDNLPMLDLAHWVRFRWHLKPKIAVGDTRYGTTENIVALERNGIRAYLPTPDFRGRTGRYPPERFQYDAAHNLYRCPQNQELRFAYHIYTRALFVYQADAQICQSCAVRAQCTQTKGGRQIQRSFYQEYLERVEHYHQTQAYQKAIRKRHVWVEPLFAEGKQWHQMEHFRLRSLAKVNIEGVMKAAGQNIKRLLRTVRWPKPHTPAGGVMLLLLFWRHFARLALVGHQYLLLFLSFIHWFAIPSSGLSSPFADFFNRLEESNTQSDEENPKRLVEENPPAEGEKQKEERPHEKEDFLHRELAEFFAHETGDFVLAWLERVRPDIAERRRSMNAEDFVLWLSNYLEQQLNNKD